MSVKQAVNAFKRIRDWAAAHKEAKAIVTALRPPAPAAELDAFEAKSKLKLPPELRAIYRLHDGQDEILARDEDLQSEAGLFPSLEAGDLAFLLVPVKQLKGNTPTTKRASRMPGYRLNWIGFGDNYGGDNLVLDYADTTPPEKRGRVLQFNHEYGCATEVAPSFGDFLDSIANGLTKKTIRWDSDAGLSYKKSRDWDDLIEAKKVEYDPEAFPPSSEDE